MQNMAYPHNRLIIFSHKNEVVKYGPVWLSLENIMLSEGGQTQNTTHCMFLFT